MPGSCPFCLHRRGGGDGVERRGQVRGVLKVSAPTSFGRLHIAPYLTRFLDAHPQVTVELTLSDAFVDIVGEGLDLAVRIAELADTSLVARRLAPNHRVLCATPDYLARQGEPASIDDLVHHRLMAHNADHWRLEGPQGRRHRCDCRDRCAPIPAKWCARRCSPGSGFALRSTWDVGPELKSAGSGAFCQPIPAASGWRSMRSIPADATWNRRSASSSISWPGSMGLCRAGMRGWCFEPATCPPPCATGGCV